MSFHDFSTSFTSFSRIVATHKKLSLAPRNAKGKTKDDERMQRGDEEKKEEEER